MPNTPSDHNDRGKWQRTDARVLSSIQLKRDGSGFTMKMGGAGTIFYDMERLTAIGPSTTFSNQVGNGACANVDNAKCDDPTTMDVTAAFDNPAKDPDGDASWHFRMVVPTNPDTPHTETRPTGADQLPDWLKFTNADGKRAYRVNPSYTGVVDLGDDGAMGGDDADAADTMGYANLDSEEYTDPTGAKYKVAWLPSAFTVPTGATLLEGRRATRIDAGLPVDQLASTPSSSRTTPAWTAASTAISNTRPTACSTSWITRPGRGSPGCRRSISATTPSATRPATGRGISPPA